MLTDIYTTHQVAKFCKVDIATITNWIDEGKLAAYKTPGGHRRILKKDLVAFFTKYAMPMPPEVKGVYMRILVVDDEKPIVEVITRALKKSKWKFELESAYDGFEAGIKIANFLPDLVVLDINLPGIDGFKVLKEIRSNEELKNIKVLAISGKHIPTNKNGILECGADKFLAKPLDLKELITTVEKMLDLHENETFTYLK